MTDTQVVKKKSDDLDLDTNSTNSLHMNEHECIRSMQAVYNGKIWIMPLFAQQLVSYLYEDMPVSDNPRVVAHHLATRGMFVMQKAYQLSDKTTSTIEMNETTKNDAKDANDANDENKESFARIEYKDTKNSPQNLAREGLCILLGSLYGKQQYFSFLILLACVCLTHPLYDSISLQTKKYLTCVYICLVAYTIYE